MITSWHEVASIPAGRGAIRVATGCGEAGIERLSLTYLTPRLDGKSGPQYSAIARVCFDTDVAGPVADALERAVEGLDIIPAPIVERSCAGSLGMIGEPDDEYRGIEVTVWQGRKRRMVSVTALSEGWAVRAGEDRRPVACVTVPVGATRLIAGMLRRATELL